ncbi:MAG: hypothetical protein A2Y45_07980 [Tenericutes bacterium GWC2_34_14]|nr:MAG: hypothetical protein A2Y45_07980 [Tenericutes bacterium GWC2_34_14]OHE34816.1 MAG: hypothetical protein A2012_01590 [Tenericutes bacterium GWE2_34_108]OHE37323.1 MAG: hypothetical protein A2Y46_01420 [Tenericutes bacterium GWF1_35_14]OHE39544.1 MAG: hypothetical protein A2Y44_01440 [Tenericutes bacterium GWF2_35_184]OHE44267.1 MAG: hypothetical protein A2221_04070 [Tenericutes bacterium RIFOXYA2_FULL_36_32]OHE47307.1 MAG: hypothetical protein A2308_03590 [Tenericutes bacterium RIFOXYB2
MKKITILVLLVLLQIRFFPVLGYESVTSATQTATNYLEVRPGSNKSNTTLTLSQLNSYFLTVKNTVSTAKQKMYDIDGPALDARILTVENALNGVTTTMFNNNFAYYYGLYEELFSIYGATIDSRVVDGRGMWHRPYERNLTEVQTTLQEMQDMGMNMLYVETFWLGRLIYDSNVPGTFQHAFTLGEGYGSYGSNLLLAFVEEGKKYGIEVHAWVENFFVGYGTSYLDSPVLAANPDWASINFDYSIPQRSEVNYLFMDPANPETRRYLKDIYAEIASTMEVSTIHLDYIRYPVAKSTTSTSPTTNLDTGYSTYAEAEFKNLYGYTGDLRTLVTTNSTIAAQWKTYKKNIISDFVAGVYYTVKNVNPEVGLSTAIFGNVESAINEKMQDWASWAEDGLIEIITPMSYYQSSLTVGSETLRLTNLVGNNAFSYAGLAPTYMGYNEYLNTTQIQAALYNNAQGTAFFASQFYMLSRNDYSASEKAYALEVQKVLTDGIFRKSAIRPHENPELVVDAIIDDMLSKIDRIYIPRNGLTEANALAVIDILQDVKDMVITNKTELEAVIASLQAFSPTAYASGATRDRILEDRNYLIKVLTLQVERMTLDETIDISVNPDPDTVEEPVVLNAPSNLRISNGSLLWDSVDHALRYELVATKNGVDQVINVSSTSYHLINLTQGDYTFKVRAIGDSFFYETSVYSNSITHSIVATKLATPTNLTVTNGIVTFDSVEGALGYLLVVDFSDFELSTTSFNLASFNLAPGTYTITVKAVGNGNAILDSDVSAPYYYVIEAEKTAEELLLEEILANEMKELIFALLKGQGE